MIDIDVGTVSARGQVAIPCEMREKMHLKEGEKVLFILEGDSLIIKRANSLSWEKITEPLREGKKKFSEDEVVDLIHKSRAKA